MSTPMRGTLFIVAAPSGAGKSSIVNACLARDANIRLSISFTSRAARPGERHAQHYHFVSADENVASSRATRRMSSYPVTTQKPPYVSLWATGQRPRRSASVGHGSLANSGSNSANGTH